MARFENWDEFMAEQRRSGVLGRISDFVTKERKAAAQEMLEPRYPPTYPASADVFRFTTTPLRSVKVVILGQDPYHQPGQAHGLAFSVPEGVAVPPSLRNIFRELDSDYYELMRQAVRRACDHVNKNGDFIRFDGVSGTPQPPSSGDLTPWTRQGVLLLNTALTVRQGEPGSHLDTWQPFTDEVVRAVVDSAEVAPHFILWGAYARSIFSRVLSTSGLRHLEGTDPDDNIFRTVKISKTRSRSVTCTIDVHPSPLSATKGRGFFGSRPFSRANLALKLNNPGRDCQVDWRLS